MYRRRRSYRRRYYGRRIRYSNETYANTGLFTLNGAQPAAGLSPDLWPAQGWIYDNMLLFPSITVVPATDQFGVRKVKNFSINLSPLIRIIDGQAGEFKLCWALVYVPENTGTSQLIPNVNGSMYEPNQNVIACGVADPSQANRYYTKLARNLNSGDRIMFVCFATSPYIATNPDINARIMLTVNYAICYN